MDLWRFNAQRSAVVRSHLIDAALRIAETEGLDALTFRRVAEVAQYSKGAVQHHFSTRESLSAIVLETWCRHIGELILEPAQKQSHGIGFVWAVTEAWLAWSERIPIPFHALSSRCAPMVSVVDFLAADWFELTRAALERSRQLGELATTVRPVQLAIELHALLWSTPWAWTVADRRLFLTTTATAIHRKLEERALGEQLLPRLEDRLAMILRVAEGLAPPRPRPDPLGIAECNGAGMRRLAFEDLIHPDAPGRVEWEERVGRPTRTMPAAAEPLWLLRAMELQQAWHADKSAQKPAATASEPTPEELAEFERLMAEQRAKGEEERRQDAEAYARAEAFRNSP